MKKRTAICALIVVGLGSSFAAAGAPTEPALQASLPTPESVLGFRVGADFKLASYDDSMAYFRALAAASDRIELREVGRSSEGRRWYMALVSSPQNLARVDEYRDIARRLAHPLGVDGAAPMLSDEEARALAARGKAIVHIDGGLHASEVAHAQHTIQLAYDLVSNTDDPEIQAILDEVVLMLWPSVNPDGQNLIADWYRGNVGTPYEVSPMPWLYQKYVGHDNNRDGYMLNMVESRVLARTWRHWEPQIIYIHHQSSPFPTRIWLPPFAEPIATRVHPLMSRTVNAVGMLIAQALEERGQTGAVHMGTGFDAWYPGYVDYMPMLRNIASWWTETALYAYATPKFYTLRDYPEGRRELRSESLYPSPWRGGWWRLRDAVEYMLTGSIATLDYAAKYRSDLLYNRYQAARDTILRYRRDPPYAYLIPVDQRDPVAAVELLRRLAFNGLRVYRLAHGLEYEGSNFDAGTWVVPMAQEDAELARQVLEAQAYPDLREYPEGPPEQPYDAAGWTLPYQMGVRVIAGATPLDDGFRASLERVSGDRAGWQGDGDANPEVIASYDRAPFDSVTGVGFDTDPVAAALVPPSAPVGGQGVALAVRPAENNSFRAVNRTWRAGGSVRLLAGHEARYVLSGLSADAAAEMVRSLALRAERRSVAGVQLQRPRIGLYRPWTANMDEGWTRWLLEGYDFEFGSLRDADVRAGGLRDRYDVVVLPDARQREIREGHSAGTVPPRYAGGVGEEGARALARFVDDGGTLVAMNNSSLFAIDALGLPVENALADLGRDEFFAGISQLEVVVDTTHPLMAGMPRRASLTVSRSPVFRSLEGFDGEVLMHFSEAASPLLSGYLLGEEHLHGNAAALRVKHGEGQVVLLGFRPQWRGQSFGTFRALFNALLAGGIEVDVEEASTMPPR